MGKKNKKVPPIVIKQPFVPIIDREPDIADVPAAAPAFEDMEENPIFIETEHENLINGEKPSTACVAALADTEQNPRLMDSLITGEKLGIDLKDVGIGTLAGAVKPVVDPKPKPESTGRNSAGSDSQP